MYVRLFLVHVMLVIYGIMVIVLVLVKKNRRESKISFVINVVVRYIFLSMNLNKNFFVLDKTPSLQIKYNRSQREVEEKLSKYIVVRFIRSISDRIFFPCF